MTAISFVDLFCGGGGSVTGAINAMREACHALYMAILAEHEAI